MTAARHLEVVGPAPTLDELANTVRREHALAANASMQVVEHAIRAGEALNDAKTLVPRGGWERWLVDEFPDRHPKTLRTYMRLAKHADTVRGAHPLTIKAADRLLIGESFRPADDELRDEAKKLRAKGMTLKAIATELGVSQNAVSLWLNPKLAERRRNQRRQESRAARRALHRQERDRAVKRAGGDIAASYAFIRRAALALEEAAYGETDREVRNHLNSALERAYRVEDEIVRASKLK